MQSTSLSQSRERIFVYVHTTDCTSGAIGSRLKMVNNPVQVWVCVCFQNNIGLSLYMHDQTCLGTYLQENHMHIDFPYNYKMLTCFV